MAEEKLFSCQREVSVDELRNNPNFVNISDPEEGQIYVTTAPLGFEVRVWKPKESEQSQWHIVPEDGSPPKTIEKFRALWGETVNFDEYLYDDMCYVFLVCSESLHEDPKAVLQILDEKLVMIAAFMRNSENVYKLLYPGPGQFFRRPHPFSTPGTSMTVTAQVPLNVFNIPHLVSMSDASGMETLGYYITHIVDGKVRDRFKVNKSE